jgi:hypothetical protein
VAKLGTVNCTTTTYVSPTSLTCVAPDQAGGLLLAVTVTNPDAQTGTLAAAWTQYFFFDGSSFAAWDNPSSYHTPFFTTVTDPDTGRSVSQIQYVLCNVDTPAALGVLKTSYAGGSYALRTYYIRYTFKSGPTYSYINTETHYQSAVENWAIGANNLARVTAPTIPDGLTYYNVYVSTAVGGPFYLQNASPLATGNNWSEPSSCPTGTCTAGTSLSTDTATFSTPASPACGVSHDTAADHLYGTPLTFNYTTTLRLDPSNPYYSGVPHFWTRGYVKFHLDGNGDANVQRKVFYPKLNNASQCPDAGVGYCYSGTLITRGGTGTGNQQDWEGVWGSADRALGPYAWRAGTDTNIAREAKSAFPAGDVSEQTGCTGTTEQTLYISRAYRNNVSGVMMQWADEVSYLRHGNQCLHVVSPPAGANPHASWRVYVGVQTRMTGSQGSSLNTGTPWTEPTTCPTAPNCFAGTFISNVVSNATQPQYCSSVAKYWDFNQWYYWEFEWQNNSPGGGPAFDGNGRIWVQGPSDPQPVLVVECPNVPTSGPFTGNITLYALGNQSDRLSFKLINDSRMIRDVIWTDTPQSMCPDFAGNPGVYPCIGPMASLLPASYTFNSTNVGDTSPDSPEVFTYTNNTSGTINIASVAIGGTNPGDFSRTTTCGATLAAGASCTASASFTPTALGARSASLVITDDAPGSPHSAALSGTGTGAPPAPAVSLSPSAVPFLPRTVGTTSDAVLVTLYNSGDGTLNITSIVATGDFSRTTTCGATLAAAASCDISVTFTPTAGGVRTGAIMITSDAATSPDPVSLSGVGLTTLTLKGFTGHFTKN